MTSQASLERIVGMRTDFMVSRGYERTAYAYRRLYASAPSEALIDVMSANAGIQQAAEIPGFPLSRE